MSIIEDALLNEEYVSIGIIKENLECLYKFCKSYNDEGLSDYFSYRLVDKNDEAIIFEQQITYNEARIIDKMFKSINTKEEFQEVEVIISRNKRAITLDDAAIIKAIFCDLDRIKLERMENFNKKLNRKGRPK